MEGMVVPKEGFPVRRKALCCGKQCKRGEAILVIPIKDRGGNRVGQAILHCRCLRSKLANMPLDSSDYDARFNDLRQQILDSGEAFPTKNKKRALRRVDVLERAERGDL